MILVFQVPITKFEILRTWKRCSIIRIFRLTLYFDLAFHKDDPYFPGFKEVLLEGEMIFGSNEMNFIVEVSEDWKMTNSVPFVNADYDFRDV